ncbi:unnamed protein product, partial [Musa acuminata subsp. burmannicoides]
MCKPQVPPLKLLQSPAVSSREVWTHLQNKRRQAGLCFAFLLLTMEEEPERSLQHTAKHVPVQCQKSLHMPSAPLQLSTVVDYPMHHIAYKG